MIILYKLLDLTKSQSNHDRMSHTSTLVGYGTDDKFGLYFWIVKNLWGKAGEKQILQNCQK